LLTRILPGKGTGDDKKEGSIIKEWPENVLLISARPDDEGKAILIHLRETGGRETILSLKNGITGNPMNISEADVTGKSIHISGNRIGPLESKFFLIRTDL